MTTKHAHILGKKLELLQPEGGFHTGLDAVMLAAACPAKGGARILDMGCGVGAAGLATIYRINDTILTGIDVQDDHVRLARENAILNGFEARADFACADIRDFRCASFSDVICNPPYMEAGAHSPAPSEKRAKALGHIDTSLDEWVACAFDCIKGQGSLTMIHRADMLQKIILSFGKRFGALQIIPLWPKEGMAAKRVIVRGWKHKKGGSEILPGLVLHNDDGSYTEKAEEILREGKAL